MFTKGQVVFSAAGRDKDSFFVVVDVREDGFLMIADGKRRKLSHPKPKNPRHLRPTRSAVDLQDAKTDRALRLFLRGLDPEAERAEE